MATSTDPKKLLGQLTDMLELYLVKKAPFTLPANLKELIVNFAPWLMVISIVLQVLGLLTLIGLGAFTAPFMAVAAMAGSTAGFGYVVGIVFMIGTLVFSVLAFSGLKNRKMSGWTMVYYADLLMAVHALIRFDLFGLVIGTTISLYFLFQVKEYYK